jgi:glycosyltransferase involved in cell wall biosynthesis
MEAMASGLPVVTTSVGALSEEVEDGVTGFLIPADDAGSLADATMRLVTDADLRQRMGVAARRAATKLFNGSQNYRRLLEVCKNCVDRRGNGG